MRGSQSELDNQESPTNMPDQDHEDLEALIPERQREPPQGNRLSVPDSNFFLSSVPQDAFQGHLSVSEARQSRSRRSTNLSDDRAVRNASRVSIFREADLVENPTFARRLSSIWGMLFQAFLFAFTVFMYSSCPLVIHFAHSVPGVRLDLSDYNSNTAEDFLSPRAWTFRPDCSTLKINMKDGCWNDALTINTKRRYTGTFKNVLNGPYTFFMTQKGNVEGTLTVHKPSKGLDKIVVGNNEPAFLEFDGEEIVWNLEYTLKASPDDQDLIEVKYLRGHPTFSAQERSKGRTVQLMHCVDWHDLETETNWKDIALRPAKGRVGRGVYIEATVIAAMYVCSIIFGFLAVLGMDIYGKTGFKYLKMSFDHKAILLFAPASAGWALADAAEVISVGSMNPVIFMVLLQMRLVLTVFTAWLMLGRKPNKLQWGLVCALNCLSIGFAVADAQSGEGGDIFPYLMLAAKIFLSVWCGVYGEIKFQGGEDAEPVPFIVQCNQIGLVSCPTAMLSIPLTAFTDQSIFKMGFFSGLDFGWDWRTVLVVVLYLVRNYAVNLVIKRFDATVKNICSAAAVIACYIIGLTMNMEPFSLSKIFLFIVLIAIVGLYFTAGTWIPQSDETTPLPEATCRKSSTKPNAKPCADDSFGTQATAESFAHAGPKESGESTPWRSQAH